MADQVAATARALGLSERDIRAQQEALQKGFRGQPRHAASREADSKADIAATARDLGLSERDLLEQQSAYSGHTAAYESRPSSGRAPTPHPPPSTSFPAFVAFLSRWVLFLRISRAPDTHARARNWTMDTHARARKGTRNGVER